jgi:hypothetical protein
MDAISQLYSQLVNAIIRPPRFEYCIEDLGPAEFNIGRTRYKRDDFEVRAFPSPPPPPPHPRTFALLNPNPSPIPTLLPFFVKIFFSFFLFFPFLFLASQKKSTPPAQPPLSPKPLHPGQSGEVRAIV